jgi:predicted TIM-barrel fold metal-dependent hydrolase
MLIDVHFHPLVKDAEYVPDLSTSVVRFFRAEVREEIERKIRRRSLEDVVEDMDAAGVDVGVMVAMDLTSTLGVTIVTNDSVSRMVRQYPERFVGFASVDPRTGEHAVRELERAVSELDLKGLKLLPPVQEFAPDDPAYNPLWEKALELGIPVWTHAGHQVSTPGAKAKFGHPALVDELALRFPELTIIMGHCAWPWVWEAWSVCLRHPRVVLDISAYWELYHYFPWDAFSKFGMEHKLLFATDYPLEDFQACIDAVRRLDISEAFKEKILGENAAELLSINVKRNA